MELRAVTYEERRTRFFKDQIKKCEEMMEAIKAYGISDEAKHIALSEEGEKIQFLTDALNALTWHKIEADEEGLYTGNLPDIAEEALFCRKDGSVYIDELCDDGVYDDGNIMVYLGDSGHDLDTVAAWMPLPKPYKE